MGNMLFGAPNWISETGYITPVFGGGSWSASSYLTNFMAQYFIDRVQSTTTVLTDTRFEVDLTTLRDLKVLAITDSNLSRTEGQIRVRGASGPAWQGVTLNANASAGATTIAVTSTGNAFIRAGDVFTLPGDSTVYTATGDLKLGQNYIEDSWYPGGVFTGNAGGYTDESEGYGADGVFYALDNFPPRIGKFVEVIDPATEPGGYYQAVDFPLFTLGNFSGYIRPLGRDYTRLRVKDLYGDLLSEAIFNLIEGVVESSSGGVATITPSGYGLYRCSISFDSGANGDLPELHFMSCLDATGAAYDPEEELDAFEFMLPMLTEGAEPQQAFFNTDGTTFEQYTGNLSFKRSYNNGTGLTVSATAGDAVTCISGDYLDTLQFNTEIDDYYPVVYSIGDKPWGHPSVWDGKESPEDIALYQLPNQWSYVLSEVALCRYLRFEFMDADNTDGYLWLTGLYITSAYEPTYNMSYGTTIGTLTNTVSEQSAGGAEAFNEEKSQRFIDFSLENIEVSEMMTNVFDLQRQLDLSGDIFFIYDTEDTTFIKRRRFPARFESLDSIGHNFYDAMTVRVRMKERLV